MSDFDQLARNLALPLKGWGFLHIDTTRDLGRGTTFPASADIPGGLQSGDRFWRTDLGWGCFWDGARWLTVHEYVIPLALYLTQITTAAAVNVAARMRTDYAPYITRVSLSSFVLTTNDASNYWTISTSSCNATFGSFVLIDNTATNGQAAGAWTAIDRVPNQAGGNLPANYGHLVVGTSKTGNPGTLQLTATASYRLIVT